MSSDQWDPEQEVRVRLSVDPIDIETFSGDSCPSWREMATAFDSRFAPKTRWSAPMPRWQAERWLASAEWLACPMWKGKRVMSAAIVVWTHA
jgi:hypothetical protein